MCSPQANLQRETPSIAPLGAGGTHCGGAADRQALGGGESSMPSVAFATYHLSPQPTDDDRLVADVLRRRGVDVHPAVWDAPDVDWFRFDRVVIRSTWDYHLKPGLYAQWVHSFLPTADRLWNPPTVVASLNKRYLIELAEDGVNVVPTAYVRVGDHPEMVGQTACIAETLAAPGWIVRSRIDST
jgi:hypothetical protein